MCTLVFTQTCVCLLATNHLKMRMKGGSRSSSGQCVVDLPAASATIIRMCSQAIKKTKQTDKQKNVLRYIRDSVRCRRVERIYEGITFRSLKDAVIRFASQLHHTSQLKEKMQTLLPGFIGLKKKSVFHPKIFLNYQKKGHDTSGQWSH